MPGLRLCVCNAWLPGLPLIKCDTILLQRGSTKSDGAAFLSGDRGNNVTECLSLLTATHHFSAQLFSLSVVNCIVYVVVVVACSCSHNFKSSAYNAALMPQSSDSRSLMKNRNNEEDRASPCWTPCLSGLVVVVVAAAAAAPNSCVYVCEYVCVIG